MTGQINLRRALRTFVVLGAVTASAQTPRVTAIEIQGSNDPSLARYVTVKVGEPSDPETIRSSVLLLSATNLFDEISVEEAREKDGSLRLVFMLKETPKLGELIFVTKPAGHAVDVPLDEDLAKSLARVARMRASERLRDESKVEAAERMTSWLRANGYARAEIEIEPTAEREKGESQAKGVVQHLKVRVLHPKQEILVSLRIDGWPENLPPPRSPGRLGQPITDATIESWKKALLDVLRKNKYYRAEVRHDSVEGDLVYFVNPGPPFDLKLDLLREVERLKARSRFDQEGLSQEAIEEMLSAVESDYIQRGYRDVDVDFQEVPNGARVTGDLVARVGPAFVLTGVEFQTAGVKLPPRLVTLKLGAPWVDAEIEAEKTRIRGDLLQQGYAGAQVSHEESGDPGNARVIFKILPGVITTVGSVAIHGSPASKDRSGNLAIELLTREASPFRSSDVARDRTALLASLRDDGYVEAGVEAITDFSDNRASVAVVFQVTAGPRIRVGRILVVGLRDTKETVVFRESRLKEGDFLSYQKLLDTQAGLSATGLFSNVQIRELAAGPDERNLIIEVFEGARTTIVPGLGFEENEKFRASVELTKLNVSGLGRSASLFFRGSIRGSRALLSLTEPYAFGRRQAVNAQLYSEDDRSRKTFHFRRLGFKLQTIFPVPLGNVLARYTFQETTTSNVAQDCAEVNRDLCDGNISGPSLGFVHDTRNDAIDPRRGGLYSVETLVSLSHLGGDSFLKTSVFAARYEELRAGTVLAASARLGLSRAFGLSTELPLPERFFAGGSSVMRGFKTDEVGPGRFNAESQFVPAGGNALIAGAIEARIDVRKYWGFQVFVEAGNVFSQVSTVRLRDLREVAGVGVRYRSPFGPLRLDWGFKLDRRAGESRQQLHIGVGYAF